MRAITSESSVFPQWQEEILFMLFFVYNTVNFLLINGCGTRENNIRGHCFFKVALVSSPIL